MTRAWRRHGSLLLPLIGALSLPLAGCTGLLGDAGEEPDRRGGDGDGDGDGDGELPTDGGTPLAFACDPARVPSPAPLRRLSRRAYENTLRDLAAHFLGDEAAAVVAAIETPMLLVPPDAGDDFETLDQAVTQDHVGGTYEVARAFAAAATATEARLGRLVGACATNADTSDDAACLSSFVLRFGERALRRPPSDAELQFFATEVPRPEAAPVAAESVRDVVAVMLLAPQFLYHVEDGREAPAASPDQFPLTGFEIASRLSYHFWGTLPDDALFAAAHAGTLETEEGFESEARRVFADPRTTAALDVFFEEWLRLEEVPPLDVAVGTPAYDAFAGADAPTPELREHMIEEVLQLTRAARGEDAGFSDLFLSDASYATTDDLARIYGVPAWQPGGDSVHFPDGQRSGLLTRAALLATSLTSTRPIHKGVTIRRRVLCDELGDPPADLGEPPVIDPLSTTRQKTEELTMQDGSSCAGCHGHINPLGYASESFDALGRFRTEEVLYDASGAEIGRLPVDTRTVPHVLFDDEQEVEDAVELAHVVIESGKPQACFARHYFRFTHGREEDLEADGCALERVRVAARDADSLREALLAIALDPSFRMRARAGE